MATEEESDSIHVLTSDWCHSQHVGRGTGGWWYVGVDGVYVFRVEGRLLGMRRTSLVDCDLRDTWHWGKTCTCQCTVSCFWLCPGFWHRHDLYMHKHKNSILKKLNKRLTQVHENTLSHSKDNKSLLGWWPERRKEGADSHCLVTKVRN